MTSVRELQHVAGLVESDKDTRELNKWLVMLIALVILIYRPSSRIME